MDKRLAYPPDMGGYSNLLLPYKQVIPITT